jgi:phage/conjugal plasmid C-4 type zinc finger TraR family protein
MSDQLDQASDLEEMERNLAINNRVRYVGISATRCGRCGVLIPRGRRDAVPGCTRCVECVA